MRFGIDTLDDFEVGGKTVLCRIDINQPIDRATGTLRSTARIEACVPTVRELSDRGARLVLLAHQGSDIEYGNFYSTAPHAPILARFLGREVRFLDDVTGPAARAAIAALRGGEILLLDNVRFCAEEQTLFEQKLRLTPEQQARTQVVEKLAPLADLYVCDAFAAAHRDQPSLCGFEQVLPSAMGRLFEREYSVVSGLMADPARPCVFVLGGAKVSDAFRMMETVLQSGAADMVLTGGLVGNIFLLAAGRDIGSGSLDAIKKANYGELLPQAGELYRRYRSRIVLPSDIAYEVNGSRREGAPGALPPGVTALDIGAQTAAAYRESILRAKTVFVNGPMGVFENAPTEDGTRAVWSALAETAAFTVVGGGDSITATAKFGATAAISYICTGGGALIRFLTGEELPAVRALRHAAAVFPADRRR